MEKQLLTISEAAEVLGVSKRKLYKMLERGELESVCLGRSRRVPLQAIEAYIQGIRDSAAIDAA